MKRLVVLLALLVLGCGYIYASDGANWDNPTVGKLVAPYLNHDHGDRDDAMGLGADIIVYENDELLLEPKAKIETRYDFNNQEGAVFGVVEINVWSLLK